MSTTGRSLLAVAASAFAVGLVVGAAGATYIIFEDLAAQRRRRRRSRSRSHPPPPSIVAPAPPPTLSLARSEAKDDDDDDDDDKLTAPSSPLHPLSPTPCPSPIPRPRGASLLCPLSSRLAVSQSREVFASTTTSTPTIDDEGYSNGAPTCHLPWGDLLIPRQPEEIGLARAGSHASENVTVEHCEHPSQEGLGGYFLRGGSV